MKKRNKLRGFASMVLAAALIFHTLPQHAGAVSFQRITSLEELTTGQYVLVSAEGYSPGRLEEGCVTSLQIGGGIGSAGAAWTLTVTEDAVTLTDSGGTTISPAGDGTGDLVPGDHGWQVSCADGRFSFHGMDGEAPVILAAHVSAEQCFRAWSDSAASGEPEGYSGTFALYKVITEAEPPVETEETTAPTEETTVPTEETTASTEETTAETEEPETVPEEPETTEPALDFGIYFGQLHSHTNLSDGQGGVEEAFQYASQVEGLDFFAVTDHSNSFDNNEAGSIVEDGTAVSWKWAAGKAAAAAVTDGEFVGIFGYEMTWQEGKFLGHIGTFNTPGWQSRNQAEFSDERTALENYYNALTTVPASISQFNHPGVSYGDFENYSHYCPAYDGVISLLEVGSGDGFTAYDYYTRALDKGWHVAPTNNQNNHNGSWGDANDARTVVLANALTEADIYDALRSRRVYATEDGDLTVYYRLNGHIMGSILGGATSAEICVYLHDPTDEAIGEVEVIVDGGASIASRTVEVPSETVAFSLPGGYSYYYLRITQPDGDIAVTAPVWLESYTDLGIESFTADTRIPVQNQEIQLTLKLFNEENVDFTVESIVFTAGGETIHTADAPVTVAALDTLTYTLPYTYSGLGATEFRAVVTGTVGGETRTYEGSLTVRYVTSGMVSRILVDGAHGNSGVSSLEHLAALAADGQVEVKVVTGEITEEMLSSGMLIVSAPAEPFSDGFVSTVAEFAASGGSVVICGQAGENTELNRLLAAVGSTLRLNNDTALDEVNNGGAPDALYTTVFNPESPWLEGITAEQLYSQHTGCTVDAGSGIWLVKGFDTAHSSADPDGETVLLALEETVSGGRILVSGSMFLSDDEMKAPKNYWEPESINQTILEGLLDIQKETVEIPLTGIADVRSGEPGEVYRIRGYVTAGSANKYNTFPGTIYLQDDTGGIPVVSVTETGIQVGAPMEVIGYLDTQDGNPVLEVMDCIVLEEDYYRYVPKTTAHKSAMDYAKNGGKLLQVEGKVVGVEYTADGKGVSRFTVKDGKGDLATVLVEDYIFSGSSGKNTLASEVRKGKTVRAIGIVHLDESGSTVLRVRNCDEVVYVPPVVTPETGDGIGVSAAAMLTAAALLCRRKKRR